MGFSEAVKKLNEQRAEILANLANYVHCLDNEPAEDGEFYDYYCFDISACKGIWMYLANNDGFIDKPDRFSCTRDKKMISFIQEKTAGLKLHTANEELKTRIGRYV